MDKHFSSGLSDKSMLRQFYGLVFSSRRKQDPAMGFTLTEVLVVVILAGVLAAIAAPGWLTFLNRQRVGAANQKVLQMLREAQSEAIAKRTTYGVSLDPGDAVNGPSITKFLQRGQGSLAADVTPISTELLGDSETKGLDLASVPNNASNEYRFNFDGSINSDGLPEPPATSEDYVFKIEVSKDGTRRCVIVETLLGAMSEGSGDECDE